MNFWDVGSEVTQKAMSSAQISPKSDFGNGSPIGFPFVQNESTKKAAFSNPRTTSICDFANPSDQN
jgi:hypothetical protein